ncbi:MAG: ATPase [Deltaproteobacteria bacterium]
MELAEQKIEINFMPQPQALEDFGLPAIFLANLTLKHCFHMDIFTLAELVERLKLSIPVLIILTDYLKKEKYVDDRGPDPLAPRTHSLNIANRLALTERGRSRASQLLELDAYLGPAPVTMEAYTRQTERQRIQLQGLSLERLAQVFQNLVISSEMMKQLGPAVVSGKPLFLYGPPGNGKTTIATRLGEVWDDVILVPHAVYVNGSVIRLFDENIHHAIKEKSADVVKEDSRWVRCRRPLVTTGGELNLSMLDLVYNPQFKFLEAPLQWKANNGMFLVDDFGRQQIYPQELLNRWIIPLENKRDYLCLPNGQKFSIPFEIFLVFATNLEPQTLVDDAFLRRLRSKVKVNTPTRDEFKNTFKIVCHQYKVEYNEEAVEYLLTKYYNSDQRRMDFCHPRDLIEHIIDYCNFNQLPPRLTPANLDQACSSYFVY